MTGSVSSVVIVGPLAPFADAYRAELTTRGYSPRTIVNEVRQVARLSCWLESSDLRASDLSRERVEQFLTARRAAGQRATGPGLLCLLDVLCRVGAIETELLPLRACSPADALLLSFRGYLLHERALGRGTADAYVAYARRFLDGLSRDDRLAGVTAREVTEAVLRESSNVSARAAQYFVTALRAFLRYCFVEGVVETDLSPATLTVRGGQRCSLPKRISRSDARALLDSCDRRRVVGRRDYAVILTLLRLGLRASELAGLTLDDLDWRAAELVIRGKGGSCDRLPLPADVGAAIAAYLRQGRPHDQQRREVFARTLAPIGPLGRGGVSAIVRRACRRAGSHLSGRTACATPLRVRWSVPEFRLRRSARCCGIAACRAPQSTRAWISISYGCWHRHGPEVQGDERLARARR